jgi:hypothetical protein
VHTEPKAPEHVRQEQDLQDHEDDPREAQVHVRGVLEHLDVLVDFEQPEQPKQPKQPKHA